MGWNMEAPAMHVAERLSNAADRLPTEVLKLDDATAAIVVDVDGVDYILTMARVPQQRARPTNN